MREIEFAMQRVRDVTPLEHIAVVDIQIPTIDLRAAFNDYMPPKSSKDKSTQATAAPAVSRLEQLNTKSQTASKSPIPSGIQTPTPFVYNANNQPRPQSSVLQTPGLSLLANH